MNGRDPIPKALRTEMRTVAAMIRITCGDTHGDGGLCDPCVELRAYAMERLEHCRWGADKPTCATCPTHCYKPDRKEQIRFVMRRAGPKMVLRHPWLTFVHFWKERRAKFIAARFVFTARPNGARIDKGASS
jgi:hypothetical protein